MTERSKRYYRYQKFLASDKWKTIKSKVLEKYRKAWSGVPDTHFQCFNCKRIFLHNWSNYHHVSYKGLFRRGWYKVNNIRILCRGCHYKIHKIDIEKRKLEVLADE